LVYEQSVPGSNVSDVNYVGVRFYVDFPITTSRIGGHFAGNVGDRTFFGALVELSSEVDFPDSHNFESPDVVGSSLLHFPEPSNEVYGSLVADLQPGWYALVFGSGQLGATDVGGAVRNGTDISSPSYIVWQPGEGWFNLADLGFPGLGNLRLVVEGTVVPEPFYGTILVFAALLSLHRHHRAVVSR
jgi:hypothetical protein